MPMFYNRTELRDNEAYVKSLPDLVVASRSVRTAQLELSSCCPGMVLALLPLVGDATTQSEYTTSHADHLFTLLRSISTQYGLLRVPCKPQRPFSVAAAVTHF